MEYLIVAFFYGCITTLVFLCTIVLSAVFLIENNVSGIEEQGDSLDFLIFDLHKILKWRIVAYFCTSFFWPILIIFFCFVYRDRDKNIEELVPWKKRAITYFFGGFGMIKN